MTTHNDFTKTTPEIEAKIDTLVSKMTLSQKLGQLSQDGSSPDNKQNNQAAIDGRLGSFIGYFKPEQINDLQAKAIENSPFDLPILIAGDVIHGYKTTFPIPLAESCSWSTDLAERTARAAAEEASACGIHLILAPMVDISRDGRWGRIAESAGEDPHLGCAFAAARTRGFQYAQLATGKKMACCPKHYVAYGAAEGGRDYNTVDMSENLLRDVYLPPFKAAFDAGAAVIMSAFNDLNGTPASANPFTLRTILRDEYCWPGMVLSDYNAVEELKNHGVAADDLEAATKAINAGVDMDMGPGLYYQNLEKAFKDGLVSMDTIDAALRNCLRLKFQLGLDEGVEVDPAIYDKVVGCDDHRRLAYEAACKSIVLLKNENDVLPISNEFRRVAVVGPLANDSKAPLGCWQCQGQPEDVVTILDGIRAAAPAGMKVDYVRGCEVEGELDSELPVLMAAADNADMIVAVLGESDDMSGEAQCRAYMDLPGDQQEMLEMLAATGKPVVLVLLNGRPLVLPPAEAFADAIVEAWHPGIAAGDAVAAILFGEVNPSAKLTVSFPRCEGQLPVYHSQKPTGRPAWGEGTTQFDEPFKSRYRDELNSPLYPFGYGLSYTSYTYESLKIHTPVIGAGDTLSLSVEVTNTGGRDGTETIQLYVRDISASMSRPYRELKAYKQIYLAAGQSMSVTLEVPANSLGFHNAEMQYVVEPGEFEVLLGPCSDRGLMGKFQVS